MSNNDISDIKSMITITNDRINLINDRITNLQSNYQVLNECHHDLELKFTKMETRMDTLVKLIQFFVAPGTAVVILIELLKAVKVI